MGRDFLYANNMYMQDNFYFVPRSFVPHVVRESSKNFQTSYSLGVKEDGGVAASRQPDNR